MRREMLLVYVLCCTWTEILAVSRPPGIYIQPGYDVFFKAGETVQMPCVAEAIPNANYTWTKNGLDFNPSGYDDRITQLENVGTIVINRPDDRDEGIYQCFAENVYGKSASININLREAKLIDFGLEAAKTYYPSRGDSLTLGCVAPESIPPPEVFWVIRERNGSLTPLYLDNRVTMDHESRLRFTNVETADNQEGNPYVCMATNSFVRKSTMGAQHFINPGGTEEQRQLSFLWSSPTDHFGLRGEEFKIKCIFAGNPTPDVYWTRADGKPLPGHAKLSSFGQELVFEPLEFSDQGDYECFATNSFSPQRVRRIISVRVESRPYWIGEPENVVLVDGETARFKCHAGGKPQPSVFWFINGVPLREVTDPRIDTRFSRVNPNEIVFTNVTTEDDMVIQCNATNKLGYIWGDVYLNVLTEAPTIIEPPAKVVAIAESQSVNLTCRTIGMPDPQITWFKEGEQLTDGPYSILSNGDLNIQNVTFTDAGDYMCVAENKYGSQNASGELLVRRKTQIEQGPLDLEVNATEDATFNCSATTDPEEVQNLQIEWMKDNKNITANDRRMTINKQDNSLTIFGTIVRDSGTYTCVATNGVDSATASTILSVKDRPDAPHSVRVEVCEKGNATIRWTPGSYNNAPIQYFIVQYNTTFNPDQWIYAATVDSQKNSANITLSPYANFTFRVLAYNDVGESKPSYESREVCRTQPAVPFKNPENVRTIGDRKGFIHVLWNTMPQLEQNGPGFSYIIHFKRRGDAVDSVILIEDWTQNFYEYPTGDIYTAYEIVLKAMNAVGMAQGDAKMIVGYSGEDIPDIVPTDLNVTEINSENATLAWNFDMSVVDIEATPLHGEFRGFKVQVWRRNQRNTTMREWDIPRQPWTDNTMNTTIDNLLPYAYYEAGVSVRNNFYVGRPSDTLLFRTKEGVPDIVPTDLNVTEINSENITLTWNFDTSVITQDDSPINGEFKGFKVQLWRRYQKETTMREVDISSGFANKINATIDSLLPYTLYETRVAVRNTLYVGQPTGGVHFRTKEGVPDIVPTDLKVIEINSENATLRWNFNMSAVVQDDTPVKGHFKGFMVQVWRRNQNETTMKEYHIPPQIWIDNEITATIDNLSPYTYHDARVAVRNSVHIGRPTDAVQFRTKEGVPDIMPTDLNVIKINSENATLAWNFDMSVINRDVTPVNGEFKGFKVQVWRPNQRETTMREWDIPRQPWTDNNMNTTIDNLLPFTYYEAGVSVRNNFYVGEPTSVQFRTSEGVPDIVPSDLNVMDINSENATLTWKFNMSAVAMEDTPMNGDFKGFKVQVWRRNQRETTMKAWDIPRQPWTDNTMNTTIDNLSPYTYYEAHVSVKNSFYVGRPSDIVQFRSKERAETLTQTGVDNTWLYVGIPLAVVLLVVICIVFYCLVTKVFKTGSGEGKKYRLDSSYTDKDSIQHHSDEIGLRPHGHTNATYDNIERYSNMEGDRL